jgi:flagellar secretion chaperone FliS
MNNETVRAYRQASAISASAVGQVVALYDGALRDLNRSIAAIESGDVELRVNSLNHALTIIAELQSVLDFDRGGQPARHFNSFYNVARGMIMEACVTCSLEKHREVVAMLARLRAAWAEIESKVPASATPERVRPTVIVQTPLKPSGEGNDSPATGGRWSA